MIYQLIYRPEGIAEPVRLPLSKSIAIRVSALNAVARRQGGRATVVPELSDCDDARYFNTAIGALEEGRRDIYIGEGGAPLRFFTALAASMPGVEIELTCASSLMSRPLKPLLDALDMAGADIVCTTREGYPPLTIRGHLLRPAVIRLDPSVSSQFVSALMLASPLWERGLNLEFTEGRPVSAPYIAMTAEVMRRFGAEVGVSEGGIRVEPGRLSPPTRFEVETDWSAASYFYELALLLPGRDIPVGCLSRPDNSPQGDSICNAMFNLLGVRTIWVSDGSATLRCDETILNELRRMDTPLELDLNSTPDLMPAIAVGLCFAGIRFRLTGIRHLRHKESDRLTVIANELEKVGYRVETGADHMAWTGGRMPTAENEVIATYSDHRIAMAFAPAAVKLPYLAIENPGVVEKSFPGYWDALKGLGFEIRRFGS